MKALFATGTLTLALTVALAGATAAQYQEQTQQEQTQQQQQEQTPQAQPGAERQDPAQTPTGTAGQFGAEQQELPATASPLPWAALAGLASLAGAWAVRRFNL